MTSALAWPVVVVVAVVVFGADVRKWLKERPTRVKLGPIEAEWSRQLAIAEANLESTPGIAESPSAQGDERIVEMLGVSSDEHPVAAIIAAASAVEEALRVRLARVGAQDFGQLGLAGLGGLARRQGIVNDETANAIQGLTVLRNLAAHGGTPTPEQAREYVTLAAGVVYLLRSQ